jgi:hypothetical protein
MPPKKAGQKATHETRMAKWIQEGRPSNKKKKKAAPKATPKKAAPKPKQGWKINSNGKLKRLTKHQKRNQRKKKKWCGGCERRGGKGCKWGWCRACCPQKGCPQHEKFYKPRRAEDESDSSGTFLRKIEYLSEIEEQERQEAEEKMQQERQEAEEKRQQEEERRGAQRTWEAKRQAALKIRVARRVRGKEGLRFWRGGATSRRVLRWGPFWAKLGRRATIRYA